MPDKTCSAPCDARHDVVLLALAGFALSWVIARACLQSVTIDEADSYLTFAAADWPAVWYPSSGNHVLNTLLMQIATSVFGLSHLTLRGGAIVGAAIYTASVYLLAVRFVGDPWVRRPMFFCLVFNPFVMDYMVAARGYSLALGLFVTSLFFMARPAPRAIFASICAGLSVTANFSFTYVNAAALLVFAICSRRRGWKAVIEIFLPAFLVVNVICGSTIWTFPRSQLFYGAGSLHEMWSSLAAATFDNLNPFVVNPLLARCLEFVAPALPYAFVALCLAQFAVRRAWHESQFALPLSAILLITLTLHWLAFRIAKIPLPMARTGVFFVPLIILLVATAAANQPRLRVEAVSLLLLASVYFAGCLRLGYFKEWAFDCDVKDAFVALHEMNRREGIRELASDWRYSSTLNFYRRLYGEDALAPSSYATEPPPGKLTYVLCYPESQAFVETQHLQLVYRSKRSDLVIARRR